MTIKLDLTSPKGKRTLRRMRTGNLCGYVSGKFWINFGDYFAEHVQRAAAEWVAKEIREAKGTKAR